MLLPLGFVFSLLFSPVFGASPSPSTEKYIVNRLLEITSKTAELKMMEETLYITIYISHSDTVDIKDIIF